MSNLKLDLLEPGNKISPKLADFSEKNRKSAGLERKQQWKNRMGKNRRKIGINRRKIGKERFCQLLSGRAVHARSWRVGTDNIADLSAKKSKNRVLSANFLRFFGEYPGPWIFSSF